MRAIDADALIKTLEPHSLQNGAALGWHNGIIDAVIDVIQKMPTIGGWIRVEDDQPDGECIAYSEKWDEMIIGYIYKTEASDTGYEAENEQDCLRDVSHWRPKPISPKGMKLNDA